MIDRETWLSIGREHGFCSAPVCSTHDGIPMSDQEEEWFDEGIDECISIVRLYWSDEDYKNVEPNVPTWRQT